MSPQAAKRETTPLGHGEKLSRKAPAAIAALLLRATIAEAAEAAGVSQTTLWRWMQRDDFREKLKAAQETVFEAALTTLQSSLSDAASCLRRNLEEQKPFGAGASGSESY